MCACTLLLVTKMGSVLVLLLFLPFCMTKNDSVTWVQRRSPHIDAVPEIKLSMIKSIDCPSLEGEMDVLTQEQFIARLTHICRYDKLIKPDTKEPLAIRIQIDLRHIETVEQLQFRTHMLVHYRYTDKRLAYKGISPGRGNIQGEETLRDRLWIPHLVLRNERQTQIMGIENKDTFVSINPNGEVIFSYRMKASIYCWMNLQKFPFDTQTCNINLVSWAYNSSYLILEWEKDQGVKVATQLHLTEFKLSSHFALKTEVAGALSHSAFVGNYSGLIFVFNLDREIGFYLLTYYIPSIMIVCTSWVTFYLHPDATPPRAILGTSTMLTFITLSAGQTRTLPKVSYIKFSEIWFLGIAMFIFASMAEFALVNMVWRRSKNIELKKKNSKYILKSSITPRTARKQFERSKSSINLPHLQTSTSILSISTFDGDSDADSSSAYRRHTGLGRSLSNVPSITTEHAEGSHLDKLRKETSTPKTMQQEPNEERLRQALSLAGWTTMTPHEISNWIDKRSRIVFPIAFIIFNILYWSFVYIF